MDGLHTYRYRTTCDAEDCERDARFKVAAPWSDGTWTELKNFGVYCEEHAEEELQAARERIRGIHLATGETVGEVQLYKLASGCRDRELLPVG